MAVEFLSPTLARRVELFADATRTLSGTAFAHRGEFDDRGWFDAVLAAEAAGADAGPSNLPLARNALVMTDQHTLYISAATRELWSAVLAEALRVHELAVVTHADDPALKGYHVQIRDELADALAHLAEARPMRAADPTGHGANAGAGDGVHSAGQIGDVVELKFDSLPSLALFREVVVDHGAARDAEFVNAAVARMGGAPQPPVWVAQLAEALGWGAAVAAASNPDAVTQGLAVATRTRDGVHLSPGWDAHATMSLRDAATELSAAAGLLRAMVEGSAGAGTLSGHVRLAGDWDTLRPLLAANSRLIWPESVADIGAAPEAVPGAGVLRQQVDGQTHLWVERDLLTRWLGLAREDFQQAVAVLMQAHLQVMAAPDGAQHELVDLNALAPLLGSADLTYALAGSGLAGPAIVQGHPGAGHDPAAFGRIYDTGGGWQATHGTVSAWVRKLGDASGHAEPDWASPVANVGGWRPEPVQQLDATARAALAEQDRLAGEAAQALAQLPVARFADGDQTLGNRVDLGADGGAAAEAVAQWLDAAGLPASLAGALLTHATPADADAPGAGTTAHDTLSLHARRWLQEAARYLGQAAQARLLIDDLARLAETGSADASLPAGWIDLGAASAGEAAAAEGADLLARLRAYIPMHEPSAAPTDRLGVAVLHGVGDAQRLSVSRATLDDWLARMQLAHEWLDERALRVQLELLRPADENTPVDLGRYSGAIPGATPGTPTVADTLMQRLLGSAALALEPAAGPFDVDDYGQPFLMQQDGHTHVVINQRSIDAWVTALSLNTAMLGQIQSGGAVSWDRLVQDDLDATPATVAYDINRIRVAYAVSTMARSFVWAKRGLTVERDRYWREFIVKGRLQPLEQAIKSHLDELAALSQEVAGASNTVDDVQMARARQLVTAIEERVAELTGIPIVRPASPVSPVATESGTQEEFLELVAGRFAVLPNLEGDDGNAVAEALQEWASVDFETEVRDLMQARFKAIDSVSQAKWKFHEGFKESMQPLRLSTATLVLGIAGIAAAVQAEIQARDGEDLRAAQTALAAAQVMAQAAHMPWWFLYGAIDQANNNVRLIQRNDEYLRRALMELHGADTWTAYKRLQGTPELGMLRTNAQGLSLDDWEEASGAFEKIYKASPAVAAGVATASAASRFVQINYNGQDRLVYIRPEHGNTGLLEGEFKVNGQTRYFTTTNPAAGGKVLNAQRRELSGKVTVRVEGYTVGSGAATWHVGKNLETGAYWAYDVTLRGQPELEEVADAVVAAWVEAGGSAHAPYTPVELARVASNLGLLDAIATYTPTDESGATLDARAVSLVERANAAARANPVLGDLDSYSLGSTNEAVNDYNAAHANAKSLIEGELARRALDANAFWRAVGQRTDVEIEAGYSLPIQGFEKLKTTSHEFHKDMELFKQTYAKATAAMQGKEPRRGTLLPPSLSRLDEVFDDIGLHEIVANRNKKLESASLSDGGWSLIVKKELDYPWRVESVPSPQPAPSPKRRYFAGDAEWRGGIARYAFSFASDALGLASAGLGLYAAIDALEHATDERQRVLLQGELAKQAVLGASFALVSGSHAALAVTKPPTEALPTRAFHQSLGAGLSWAGAALALGTEVVNIGTYGAEWSRDAAAGKVSQEDVMGTLGPVYNIATILGSSVAAVVVPVTAPLAALAAFTLPNWAAIGHGIDLEKQVHALRKAGRDAEADLAQALAVASFRDGVPVYGWFAPLYADALAGYILSSGAQAENLLTDARDPLKNAVAKRAGGGESISGVVDGQVITHPYINFGFPANLTIPLNQYLVSGGNFSWDGTLWMDRPELFERLKSASAATLLQSLAARAEGSGSWFHDMFTQRVQSDLLHPGNPVQAHEDRLAAVDATVAAAEQRSNDLIRDIGDIVARTGHAPHDLTAELERNRHEITSLHSHRADVATQLADISARAARNELDPRNELDSSFIPLLRDDPSITDFFLFASRAESVDYGVNIRPRTQTFSNYSAHEADRASGNAEWVDGSYRLRLSRPDDPAAWSAIAAPPLPGPDAGSAEWEAYRAALRDRYARAQNRPLPQEPAADAGVEAWEHYRAALAAYGAADQRWGTTVTQGSGDAQTTTLGLSDALDRLDYRLDSQFLGDAPNGVVDRWTLTQGDLHPLAEADQDSAHWVTPSASVLVRDEQGNTGRALEIDAAGVTDHALRFLLQRDNLVIQGGARDDVFHLTDARQAVIDGGGGNDLVSFAGALQGQRIEGSRFTSVELFTGSAFDDHFSADGDADYVYRWQAGGETGDAVVAGDTVTLLGPGYHTVSLGAGTVRTGGGNDVIVVDRHVGGRLEVDSGAGTDRVSFALAPRLRLWRDAPTGSYRFEIPYATDGADDGATPPSEPATPVQFGSLRGVERLVGSPGDDAIDLAGDVSELLSGGGNDHVVARSGLVSIDGGLGADLVELHGAYDSTVRMDDAGDLVSLGSDVRTAWIGVGVRGAALGLDGASAGAPVSRGAVHAQHTAAAAHLTVDVVDGEAVVHAGPGDLTINLHSTSARVVIHDHAQRQGGRIRIHYLPETPLDDLALARDLAAAGGSSTAGGIDLLQAVRFVPATATSAALTGVEMTVRSLHGGDVTLDLGALAPGGGAALATAPVLRGGPVVLNTLAGVAHAWQPGAELLAGVHTAETLAQRRAELQAQAQPLAARRDALAAVAEDAWSLIEALPDDGLGMALHDDVVLAREAHIAGFLHDLAAAGGRWSYAMTAYQALQGGLSTLYAVDVPQHWHEAIDAQLADGSAIYRPAADGGNFVASAGTLALWKARIDARLPLTTGEPAHHALLSQLRQHLDTVGDDGVLGADLAAAVAVLVQLREVGVATQVYTGVMLESDPAWRHAVAPRVLALDISPELVRLRGDGLTGQDAGLYEEHVSVPAGAGVTREADELQALTGTQLPLIYHRGADFVVSLGTLHGWNRDLAAQAEGVGQAHDALLHQADALAPYGLRMPDGAAVPSWIAFDPLTGAIRVTGGDWGGHLRLDLVAYNGVGEVVVPILLSQSRADTQVKLGTAGNDVLSGDPTQGPGAHPSLLVGGTGDDTYQVYQSGDAVLEYPDEGYDTVVSHVDDHRLDDNVERLKLGGSETTVLVGTGNEEDNQVIGNAGDNHLHGLGGDDMLQGGAGADTLEGGAGDDILVGGSGADTMVGGPGDDTYDVDHADDRVVEQADEGTDTVLADTSWGLDRPGAEHVENLTLTGTGPTSATGNALDNVLVGNSGHNTLSGGDGDDTIRGGAGNDTLRGEAGDDTLEGGTGDDQLDGGTGDDLLAGGEGDDVLDGAEGADTASYADAAAGVTVDLSVGGQQDTGAAGSDTLTGIENLQGSAHDDVLTGDGAANRLEGGAGNDVLRGDGPGALSLGQTPPEVVTTDFAPGRNGWGSSTLNQPRALADVDGDGRTDIVGFRSDGVWVSLQQPDGSYAAATRRSTQFGSNTSAGKWSTSTLRMMADVNGDGLSDVVGFHTNGIQVGLALKNAQGQFSGFAAPKQWATHSGSGSSAGGWNVNTAPRLVADVNADGKADVVGFAYDGAYVALSTGNAIGDYAVNYRLADFSVGQVWSSMDLMVRRVGDLNGDGRADIIGFNTQGVRVALARNDGVAGSFTGFHAAQQVLGEFGSKGAGTASAKWGTQTATPRELADVDGDGHLDIVGFGADGVYVARGRGDGSFEAATRQTQALTGTGWTSNITAPRLVADMNGDGLGDLAGFNASGVTLVRAARTGTTSDDVLMGGAGDDLLDGGRGNDTASYADAASGVTVDLSRGDAVQNTGGAGADTLVSIENLQGGDHADVLVGDGAANRLDGGAGNDTLVGQGGDDVLEGGDGADTLTGGAGNDALAGGADNDVLQGDDGNDVLQGGAGDDVLQGGAGNDLLDGGPGKDTYYFELGDGADRIVQAVRDDADKVWIAVRWNQLWFSRAGDDLQVQVMGSPDSVTVANWFAQGDAQREVGQFEALAGALYDRVQLDRDKVAQLLAVMDGATVLQTASAYYSESARQLWGGTGTQSLNATATQEDEPLALSGLRALNPPAAGPGEPVYGSLEAFAGRSLRLTAEVDHGTLAAGAAQGRAITLTGTAAQIDAALATLVYRPDADWSGEDRLQVVTWDGTLEAERQAVQIMVLPVNDAPRSAATHLGDLRAVPAQPAVLRLTNPFTDMETDAAQLQYAADGLPAGMTLSHAADSDELLLSGTPQGAGVHTVRITATDPAGAVAQTGLTLTVQSNQAPQLTSGAASRSGNEDGSIVFGGAGAITVSDADGDTQTVSLAVGQGRLRLGSTAGLTQFNDDAAALTLSGSVAAVNAALSGLTYRSAADWHGTDALTIAAADSAGAQATASVNLTIAPQPDAVADSASTAPAAPVDIDVLDNDAFADPARRVVAVDGQAITAVGAGGTAVAVAQGSVTLQSDGRLRFTPVAGYSGTTGFAYTVEAGGTQEDAGVSVTVAQPGHAPRAAGRLQEVLRPSTSFSYHVPDAFIDGDGDAMTYAVASALPTGWTYNASARVIIGTTNSSTSANTVRLRATDSRGVSGEIDVVFSRATASLTTVTGTNASNIGLRGTSGQANRLVGLAGNDNYIVDHVNDYVVEQLGAGTDTVNVTFSSGTYVMPLNVEYVALSGSGALTVQGNLQANKITGNSAANRLIGDGGDDILNGGSGDDVLDGGTGNDVFDGGSGNDTFVIRRGDGIDTVTDTSGSADVLRFEAGALGGAASRQLWFSRAGADVNVAILGSDDRVTIKGFYSTTTSTTLKTSIDAVEATDGLRIGSAADIHRLVQAMAGMAPPAGDNWTSLPSLQQFQLGQLGVWK